MMDTTTDSNIIPYDDKELIAFEDTDNAINMLFMLHESILLKDAKGTTRGHNMRRYRIRLYVGMVWYYGVVE
jgi:hypothetical protein